VLWVGIADDEGKGRLSRLFDALENGLVSRGFRREARPFSPHLTIARTRDLSSRDRSAVGEALRACQNELNLKVAVDVDHVTVFESVLSPRGATYASLAELPLELDNSAKSLR
jgi:2'-5' RNA ligase